MINGGRLTDSAFSDRRKMRSERILAKRQLYRMHHDLHFLCDIAQTGSPASLLGIPKQKTPLLATINGVHNSRRGCFAT
jgi:hypothetical protein